MKQEEIKSQYETATTKIKEANESIRILQETCQHPNVFEALFSYRVGSIVPSVICNDCKKVIECKWI